MIGKRPPVSKRRVIYRSMLVVERETLFVFGDNLARRGYGGQASAMRGEPNAVGIPTKRLPSREPDAFFTDADFHEVRPFIEDAIERLRIHLMNGGSVVLPADGIGTGLAELPTRAPVIYEFICSWLHGLETVYNEVWAASRV